MLNSNIKKPARSRRSSSSADSLFLFALSNEDIDILKAYLSREGDSQRLQNMLSAKYYSIVDIAMNNNSHNLLDLLFKQANHLRNKIINKALYNRALNLITRTQYPEATMNIIFENFSNLDFSLQKTVLSMQQHGAFIRAAENGRLQAMELFLKQAHTLGIQEDMLKEQNYQAFRTAADRGNWQVVKLLLDKAHDFNIQQAMIKARSYYAFKAAVTNNRLAVVDLLLSKTNNLIILQEMLSATDHYPFWSAIEGGNLDTLEVLWKSAGKAGVEFQKSVLNHKNYSLFHQALESGNQNSLKWLWKKASSLGLQKDMLVSNHFILNIIFEERQSQYKEILKWFKTEVDKIDSSLWTDILACSKMGNRTKRSYSCSSYVNRKDHSKQKIQNLKLQQKILISFTGFLSSLPNIKIKVIIQDPYVKTFKRNAVITRIFSQSLLLDSSLAEQFLNNLQISDELHERFAQDRQISKREEKQIISLNNLLDTFETQLASSISSLPSTLNHIEGYKTLGDLSKYVTGLEGDFSIHLGTSNHVVAIYRVGNDYAYFDSNFAYVQGIETTDQLMKVIKEGIRSAGYEVEREGFLIERFYVNKANNELTAKQKEILTKSIQTERHLLALQDQKFGPINMDGQQVHRVTLYDIGAKLHSEGSVPVLINSDMTLNKKKFISYLKKGKIRITAREYLDQLRGNAAKEIAQATKIFPFEGSRSEVKSAEKVRELISSDYGNKLKNYELDKLLQSPIEQSIKALHLEVAKTTHLPNRLTNAAGRISFLHGGYSIIHSFRHGDYESFALGTGEMGFSLFSQLIEDRIVKATPQMIKQMKHSIYLSRGFAGIVTSPFDIYDLIRSSIDTSNSVKGSKEWRDNIASAVFAGSSLVSSIAFTAMAKPGVGTIVGLGIMAGQVVYNGISKVAEYDKNYQLTTSQKSRIFLHTLTLREMPQDVQDDVIKQDIMNDYVKKAWQYLQNNTQVVAYAMGLGNFTFQNEIYNETTKPFYGLYSTIKHKYKSTTIQKSYRKHVLLPSKYSYINVSTIDQYDFSPPDFEMYHEKQTRKILPPVIKQSFSTVMFPIAYHVIHKQLFHPTSPSTEARIFCFSASPEGYCTSTAVLDHQRMNESGEIVTDLSLVNKGPIIGSNKWQNHFNIYAGRPYIFGGNSTTNVFMVNKVEFSGEIVGGDNSLNILVSNSDAKYLDYNNENGIMSSCDKESCSHPYWFIAAKISHFIGRKALPDSVNCAEDRKIYIDSQGGDENHYDTIHGCKEVVVSSYTEITSENSDGGDTLYYIKPDSGHVRINALPSKKQRFLIFPTTDLLNESNMYYSPHTNTFSIYLPMHDFAIDVKYYLSSQDNSTSYTYNFILVDKYGSVIEPLIEQKTGKIDLYYLRTETKLTKINEILEWYRSIVRLEQVYGTVASGNTSIIIGSDKSDIIPVVEGTGYVEGGKGGDLYNILPGTPISLKINNYSDDQAYDVIYIPAVYSMIMTYTGLHDLYLHVKDLVNYIQIENYLFDKHYQHLMIVDQNKNAFIPLQLGSEVKLVPFYHATKNQYIFSLSANEMNSEMVIDAMLEEITVYRDGDDLLLTSNKSLIIKLKGFYNKYWNNLTIHFIHGDKLNLEQLSELAKLAINYQEEVKNTYFDNVREYHASSSNVSHSSAEHIGVIVFEHSSNIKVSVNNKDLIFTDGSHAINVKNWSDTEHRISVLRIDNKPKAIEVRGLDKFGLSEISEIQSLINKAILSNIIDKQINKLDTEVVNGIRYLLSVRGIESGVHTDKVLDFDSIINQEQFVVAHSGLYTKDVLDTALKNRQAVEALVWLVVKGYSNLLLENYDIDRKTLLNNLEKCFSLAINKRTINRIMKKLEVENIEAVVPNIKSFIEHHKEALESRIVNSLRSNAPEITEDIKEHRRKRRDEGEEKGYKNEGFFYGQNNAIPIMECEEQKTTNSAAGMPSMLSSLFNLAKSSIDGLFNYKAVLPIEPEKPYDPKLLNISQVNAQVNVNGAIMLLDILIRKATGQKFVSSENQPVSVLEAQSYTLSITRKFDKAVSSIANKPAEELINLAEMQSKIFKAVTSGSGNKVRDILLSYATPIIGPVKAKGLLTTLQTSTKASDKSEARSLPLYEARPRSCLSNIAIFSLRMPGKSIDRQ